jgi:hypothetical protein
VRENTVWRHIDRAFATPVTRSDDAAEYVATQVIAELFRDQGFDGVAYKSSFGSKAFTLALFELAAAKLHSCHLYEVTKAVFKFSETANPYFVSNK